MPPMTQGDWDSTIDRLATATQDAREVIAEAHGATRDLRQALAEARDLLARTVPDAVAAEVDAQVKSFVCTAVQGLSADTRAAMDAAVAKVGREFTRLERLYLGTDAESQREGKPSVEAMIRRSLAAPAGAIPPAFRKDR